MQHITKKNIFIAAVFLLWLFVGYQMISAPEATLEQRPVNTQNVAVTSISVKQSSVKQVDGKYRYFFSIKNEGDATLYRNVSILLVNSHDDVIQGDIFEPVGGIPPGVSKTVYIDAHTGPASVHGEYGISKFEYSIAKK